MENSIICLLDKAGYIDDSNIYIIQSGLKRIRNVITDVVLSMLLSWLMGNVLVGAVMEVLYLLVRCHTGGYHAASEKRCQYLSWASILLSQLLVYHVEIPELFFHITVFLTVIGIMLLAPVESIHKPLSRMERKIYRKRSRIIVVGILMCYILASMNGLNIGGKMMGVTLVEVFAGMLLEGFTKCYSMIIKLKRKEDYYGTSI